MTVLGWLFMLASWGAIIVVSIFCFWKVLAGPKDDTAGGGK